MIISSKGLMGIPFYRRSKFTLSLIILFLISLIPTSVFALEENSVTLSSSTCCQGLRGNVDNDSLETVDLLDLVFMVSYSFQGGVEPFCLDESDIDGSRGFSPIDISDMVLLVDYLFANGSMMIDCPPKTFAKTYGGVNHDWARSTIETNDSGYVVAGFTRSIGAGGLDVYLFKTDNVGDVVWEKSFGGTANDYGYSVCETSDGGYIITGTTSSFGAGSADVYLLKVDSSGTLEWEKTYGGTANDFGYSVCETSDGGYVITGETYSFGLGLSDVYLIKTDKDGTLIWEKTFGGVYYDYGFSVTESSDGGYVLTGTTISFGAGNYDVYVVKTDYDGNLVWENTFGNTEYDFGNSIVETVDSGLVICGAITNSHTSFIYLLKVDFEGTLKWQRFFGGNYNNYGHDVKELTGGGFIITGETWVANSGSFDAFLIKTNEKGVVVWEKIFGGSETEVGYSVEETRDGGYIISGSTESYGAGGIDVYLIKTDSLGALY